MEWRGVGVSRMTTTEKEIIEEIRKNMISIAKPYLIDSQADPFIKEAAKTLLIRIENEESWVGKLIIGIMNISHVEGIKAGREQGEIIGRLLCANETIDFIYGKTNDEIEIAYLLKMLVEGYQDAKKMVIPIDMEYKR